MDQPITKIIVTIFFFLLKGKYQINEGSDLRAK